MFTAESNVKEFRKSVKIWRSYAYEYRMACFWLTVYIAYMHKYGDRIFDTWPRSE